MEFISRMLHNSIMEFSNSEWSVQISNGMFLSRMTGIEFHFRMLQYSQIECFTIEWNV